MHAVARTFLLAVFAIAALVPGARGGIIGLLQNNVLGAEVAHKKQSWPFDPSVSERRAAEFRALHGHKSEKLIERIGLGIDGRQHERREQQTVRDYLYDRQQEAAQTGFLAGAYPQPQHELSPRY